MKFSDNFKQAAKDYLWLLNKGYPQKKVLSLVGDRYRLLKTERSILYRGIAPDSEASARYSRLHSITETSEREIYIDGLNVLITLVAYLEGKAVFLCNDGWLRDASEIHSGKIHDTTMTKAAELLLNYEVLPNFDKAILFIDKKAESGQQAKEILKNRTVNQLEIESPASADHSLSKIECGLIATSDSQLITKSACNVVDLAKEILDKNYQPDFPDLMSLFR